jgi:hypothetical protein
MYVMPYDIWITIPKEMLSWLGLSGKKVDINTLFTVRGGLSANKIVVHACKVYGQTDLVTVYYNVTLGIRNQPLKILCHG